MVVSPGKNRTKKKYLGIVGKSRLVRRSNPANRVRGEDGVDRLAGVYSAGMDLRLIGGGLDSQRKQIDLWLYEENRLSGVKCWDIYTLSGWTRGLALPN